MSCVLDCQMYYYSCCDAKYPAYQAGVRKRFKALRELFNTRTSAAKGKHSNSEKHLHSPQIYFPNCFFSKPSHLPQNDFVTGWFLFHKYTHKQLTNCQLRPIFVIHISTCSKVKKNEGCHPRQSHQFITKKTYSSSTTIKCC